MSLKDNNIDMSKGDKGVFGPKGSPEMMFNKLFGMGGAFLVFLLLLIVIFFSLKFFVIVGAGERAVVFNRIKGVEERQLNEGFHLLIPFVQSPIIYNIKTQTYTMSRIRWEGEIRGDDSLIALTSDGQNVRLDMSIRFRVDPQNVWRLHKEVGLDYMNSILRPEVRSLARMIVSAYPVVDVYSEKRTIIQNQINEGLQNALNKYYILIDEVLVRDVGFSEEFQKAIEQKQIAQQDAQRMKYVLEKEELEKQRKIIAAEGEAQSIKLRGQALAQNPMLIQYEYVQKLSPNVQTIITDGKSIMSLGDVFKK